MVETEKQKIRKEYERKESQVEVKKKIEYSTQLNSMRLKVLTARDEAIQGMLAESRVNLTSVSSSATYQALLTGGAPHHFSSAGCLTGAGTIA
jgi:V-type H+-transporting ATPase subunit E